MDRAELTLVVAGTLVAAVMLGWTLRWIFGRLTARQPATSVSLAARLGEAEAARRSAEADLAAARRELSDALRQRDEVLRTMDGTERAHA